MPNSIRPATHEDMAQIRIALDHLRIARNALNSAGCPQAATAVREALKSAEGAERHCLHRISRTKEIGNVTTS